MDNSVEYKLMCLKAKELQEQWQPKMGDYMVSKANYCCKNDDSSCNEEKPCPDCLEMSNTYVISGDFKYHESVGGHHWYFGGHGCVYGDGNMLNSTSCYVMTEFGESNQANQFTTSKKSKMLWLPRQDQTQDIFLVGCTKVHKINLFQEYLNTKASYNPWYTSLEQLWLMFYMYEKYNKVWNETSNIKEWECNIKRR